MLIEVIIAFCLKLSKYVTLLIFLKLCQNNKCFAAVILSREATQDSLWSTNSSSLTNIWISKHATCCFFQQWYMVSYYNEYM